MVASGPSIATRSAKMKTHCHAQTGQTKKLALSDGFHIINTHPSPAPSRNSSRIDQSGVMTVLSAKKLDHEIRKTDIELIKNLRQTLAEKVVCQPPRTSPCVSCVVTYVDCN